MQSISFLDTTNSWRYIITRHFRRYTYWWRRYNIIMGHGTAIRVINKHIGRVYVLHFWKICLQNYDTRFFLRLSSQFDDTDKYITFDNRLRTPKWRQLLLPWDYTIISIFRKSSGIFLERFHLAPTRMGMVVVVTIANVDYSSYLDTEMRTSC